MQNFNHLTFTLPSNRHELIRTFSGARHSTRRQSQTQQSLKLKRRKRKIHKRIQKGIP